MATAISRNFLPVLFFLCSLIAHFLEKGHANQEISGSITKGSSNTSFYVVKVSSMIIPKRCDSQKSSSGRPKGGASLELVHRHRPNPHNIKTSAPTLAEVLFQDKARLRYLHLSSRLSKKDVFKVSEATTLNIMSGIHYRAAGTYVVTVGLGAQKTRLTLLFDTGSPLTWTQCMPCLQQCYKQQEQIFNPSNSASYTSIACNSTLCRELRGGCYKNSSCVYGLVYGDESYEVGFIGNDTLALTRSDVFKNFLFGCGQNNKGTFGEVAGILGLSRGKLSFVSQTAQKYRQYFSYCLPSSACEYGHLTFGDNGVRSRSIKFTQLLKPPPEFRHFYVIKLIAISVAGKKLAIKASVFPKAGAIIDSGTTMTYLPSEAYRVLQSSFIKEMKYPRASNIQGLDTCYDFTHYTTVRIPKVSLFFGGYGKDVELLVHHSGILYGTNKSQLCLAFARNKGISNFTIIGNVQQRTFEVVYDVAGGRLGFAANCCS